MIRDPFYNAAFDDGIQHAINCLRRWANTEKNADVRLAYISAANRLTDHLKKPDDPAAA